MRGALSYFLADRPGERGVKYFTTHPGVARLRIVDRDREVVRADQRPVDAGVQDPRWRARIDGAPAPAGRYVEEIRVIATDGQRTGDRAAFRVVARQLRPSSGWVRCWRAQQVVAPAATT